MIRRDMLASFRIVIINDRLQFIRVIIRYDITDRFLRYFGIAVLQLGPRREFIELDVSDLNVGEFFVRFVASEHPIEHAANLGRNLARLQMLVDIREPRFEFYEYIRELGSGRPAIAQISFEAARELLFVIY